LYLRQVRNGAKHDWLAYVRHKFNELRDDEPFLPNIPHVSHRQLIDLFAYGARILHRESEENAEEELKELVRLHGREQVAMAINACMHDLVGRANLAYHLIRADFNDWLNRNLIPPPDAPDARELLRSHR
jgi:hypothetical protein